MNNTSDTWYLKRGMCGKSLIPTLVEIPWDNSEENGKMFNTLLNVGTL